MSAFLNFITNEWYFAVPMFLMSFVAIALIVWRILLNRDAKTDLNWFLPRFQQKLDAEGPEAALAFCRTAPGVIAQKLFTSGLENRGQGTAAMRRAMASTIEYEILPDLNFLLARIFGHVKIPTIVGLVGAVLSFMNNLKALSAGNTGGGVTSARKRRGAA